MSDRDFVLRPFSPSERDISLVFHVIRGAETLNFTFRAAGLAVGTLCGLYPANEFSGVRRDELWKTTCFEIFFGRPDEAAYFEINLNTAGDWNAYRFSNYRSGQEPLTKVSSTPFRDVQLGGGSVEVSAEVSLREFQVAGPLVLGASAVLEYRDGKKEYWALAHFSKTPDFHMRSSHVVSL